MVGSSCGIADGLAEGRAEVEAYIRHQRTDALGQLLADDEPAAKVYGAIGLRLLGMADVPGVSSR